MRRVLGRPTIVIVAFALLATACNGDDTAETSATSTTAASTTVTTAPSTTTTAAPPATTTTTTTVAETTTTTEAEPSLASDLPRVEEGDRGDLVEALQFLLNCLGGDVTVDGAFGPGTRAAVEAAQGDLGLSADGIAGPNTLTAMLSRCDEIRRVDGEGERTVLAYSTPSSAAEFAAALVEGSTVVITLPDIAGLAVSITGADGTAVEPSGQSTYLMPASQDYRIAVTSPEGDVGYTFVLSVTSPERPVGEWILATNGITYGDTKLSIGDEAGTTIDRIFEFLGHGVRGNLDEFDTDWYPITDPQPLGLRGVFIEGLAFLFFGPDPTDPDRAETLERVRFVGPTVDADGDERPRNYVTTSEGITVGDTLAELQSVYGDSVAAGSNDDEYYYRLSNSGGELCFYFGADEPGDLSPVVEMATECRS